jgi:hypothetical protein
MDTVQPGGEGSFLWPVDLPASRNLTIGLVCWTKSPVGASEETVYLPLSLGTSADSSLRVALVPSGDASDVYLTLAMLDANGAKQPPILTKKSMGGGPFTAWRPISYTLPALAAPGLYYAEFAATWESGLTGTARMYFYNPSANKAFAR